MHEMSLMQSALDVALDHASGAGATRIVSITLRVGEISSVVPEALAFAFECMREDTLASGATLHIEPVAARCRCRACATEFHPPGAVFECPDCGRPGGEVVSGREIELSRMEIE